ncbi:hypothetical protein ABID13_004847 [Enterocloster citroniae]|uniref:Uncharacterized protein n=1 Tax=Enterocloster citroniae TaxID=358743 RepID=A0ABV2G543_9FIRM
MVVTKVVRSINRNNEASCYGYWQWVKMTQTTL